MAGSQRGAVSGLIESDEPESVSVRPPVASHQDVVIPRKVVEDLLTYRGMRLYCDEARFEPADGEPCERLRLSKLDVHREKVDTADFEPIQHVVERRGRRGCRSGLSPAFGELTNAGGNRIDP